MRIAHSPAIAILILVAIFLLGAFSTSSGAQTTEYVTYRFTLTKAGSPVTSYLVNETVQPTSQNGFVQLTLTLAGAGRDLTYSKVLNSSSVPEIFPYIFGVNNQSISYTAHGYALDGRIIRDGTSQITFNGKTYTAQEYKLSLAFTTPSQGIAYSVSGEILTVPSGLVYSVELRNGNYSATAQLLATNLALTDTSTGSTILGFTLLSIGAFGAVGIAVPSLFAFLRVRAKAKTPFMPAVQGPNAEDKPPHWVD